MFLGLQMAMAEDLTDYERGLRDGMQRVGLGTEVKEAPSVNASAENRKKHSYQTIFSYGPDYNEVTTQIGFYKFINENQLIGLKLGYGAYERNSETDAYQLSVSAEYKHFLGNSFYWASNLVYLKQDYVRDDYLIKQYNSFYRGFGAGVRIGNQWSWEHFTIGCDWIGIGAKFIHLEKNGDDVHDTYATLLNTYIGYSF